MAEFLALYDAVQRNLHDGDIVAFEGFTHLIPHAAAHEAIRQGIGNLTLLRMTRNNELTAILAAGTPLLRVAAPIILIAVVLTGLGWVDQEFVIPNIIPQLLMKHNQVNDPGAASSAKPLPPIRDSANRIVMASRYYPPSGAKPARMDYLDAVGRDEKTAQQR